MEKLDDIRREANFVTKTFSFFQKASFTNMEGGHILEKMAFLENVSGHDLASKVQIEKF